MKMRYHLVITIFFLAFCSIGFANEDQMCFSITDALESLKKSQEAWENKQKQLEDRLTELGDIPRVAFHAMNINNSIAVAHAIQFVNIILNDGNQYNPDTGLFKAAINGTYLFSVNICTGKDKWFQAQIKAGDSIIATVANFGSRGGQCTSASGLAKMVTGEIAQVECTYYDEEGVYQDGRRRPSFSGVLLH